MMAQTIKYKPTVIGRESTSAVLVTLSQLWSCKLASPPAVTPGHCQQRSVSLIMATAREAANTPTGGSCRTAGATSAEAKSRRFLLHQRSRFFAQANVQTSGARAARRPFRLNWMQQGMIRSGMNHAVLHHGVYDSDFTGAPKEESCFGGVGGSGHAWFPQGNLAAEAAERLLVGKQSVAFAGLRFLRPKTERKRKKRSDRWLFVCGGLSIGGGLQSKPQPLI